jgi:cbb3-type cytochrome oxidase subunit 3
MTTNDYIGATLAIVIALLMLGAYIYSFRPSNKEQFDNCGNIPLEE